jgi:hypothetical protein
MSGGLLGASRRFSIPVTPPVCHPTIKNGSGAILPFLEIAFVPMKFD